MDNAVGDDISLSQINELENFEQVNSLYGAECHRKPAVEESSGKKKQDVIARDATGMELITLWQDDVSILEEGVSYQLCAL